MPGNLTESTARLEQLIAQIMKEADPVKYDELGSEIWRVLEERERLLKQTATPQKQSGEPNYKNVA